MFRKVVSGIMLTLLLVGLFSLAINVEPAKSTWTGTVYIRADGSIDPPDAPITTYDNITYTLTDNITSSGNGIVVERDNVVIDGAGYTLEGTGAYEYQYRGISLSEKTNVTVQNVQIRNFYYGIWLDDSLNNSIIRNNIENNIIGIGLNKSSNYNHISENNITNILAGIGLFSSSNNNIISRNNITNKGDGIGLFGVSNNIISGNIITANWGDGIHLEFSNYNSIRENNVTNNNIGITLYACSNNSISINNITANNAGGMRLLSSSNCNSIVANNIIENNRDGIRLFCSSGNSIAGNYITKNSRYGIYLDSSSNNTITENNITNNSRAIHLYSSSNNNINRNSIAHNSLVGISVYSSLSNGIAHNNLLDNFEGIYLHSSLNNTIIANDIIDCWYGIYLYYSPKNNITANKVTNNWSGILIHCSSNNKLRDNVIAYNKYNFGVQGLTGSHFVQGVDVSNTVDGNPIYYWVSRADNVVPTNAGFVALVNCTNITVQKVNLKNNVQGVLLVNTTNSKVVASNITNNYEGIYIYFSSNNSIYHNNFINNTFQVRIYNSINTWDNGYPSGGNYWSDYNGTDLYSGVYQNETGSDGIGDTPYVIDEDNVDHYPLMNPYAITPPVPSVINASVNVNPEALNLKSRGKWITAYIELPEDYNIQDINASTIMLNDTVSAEPKPITVGDHDEDGILDLMVKFDRASVISFLANINKTKLFEERFMRVTLTITGYLKDGTPFQGTTTIRVLMPIPFFVLRHWRFCRTLQIFPI